MKKVEHQEQSREVIIITVYFCFYSLYVLTLYISIVLLYKGKMLNPRCANQKLGFRSLREFG